MNGVIIIMAKVPIAGTVKTRLQPFFTPDESAEIATVFLQDSLDKAHSASKNVILAYSPNDGENQLRKLVNPQTSLLQQIGDDLGERIISTFESIFKPDIESVLMIGTDSPTMPISILKAAFESLEKYDSVIGKTLDGGFYLIGFTNLNPDLIPAIFDQVEWSTPKAHSQTVANIDSLGLSLHNLPILYDVDTPEDILKLISDQALRETAPNTFKYLSKKMDAKL
jgi:uncharacterized protein